jgi:hypothetical protein
MLNLYLPRSPIVCGLVGRSARSSVVRRSSSVSRASRSRPLRRRASARSQSRKHLPFPPIPPLPHTTVMYDGMFYVSWRRISIARACGCASPRVRVRVGAVGRRSACRMALWPRGAARERVSRCGCYMGSGSLLRRLVRRSVRFWRWAVGARCAVAWLTLAYIGLHTIPFCGSRRRVVQ